MSHPVENPRVLVIGARRVRQGIGEFVARSFHRAGAEVCAVVGTSPDSAAAAAAQLHEAHGIACRAYADLPGALAAESPDVVAVCSPYAVHEEQLRIVASEGAHCFCEKPMWWRDGADLARDTAALVDGFLDRGLRLGLITQWPPTLDAYYELYPELRGQPVERFEMLLGPTSMGSGAVLDSLPHVLSLLQALAGCGDVRGARAAVSNGNSDELNVEFEYHPRDTGAGGIDVSVRLVLSPAPPRPAGYGLNGKFARREIHLPEYSMTLEGDGRSVALADPLEVWVGRYLQDLASGAAVHRQALIESITGLETLVAAAAGDAS